MGKIVVFLLLFGGFQCFASPMEWETGKVDRPPTIDGDLSDAAWVTCPAYSEFRVFGKDAVPRDTTVWFAHDNQWLYLAFHCENRAPEFDKTKAGKHDDTNISKDDSVEIFAATSSDAYYHFSLNRDNVKGEQKVSDNGKRPDRAWNCSWLSATRRTEAGWDAEVALPLARLIVSGEKPDFRANVARNRVIPEFDACAIRVGEKIEHSVLAPVKFSFHEPEAFARLKGLDEVRPAPVARFSLDGAAVSNYREENGRMVFDVTLEVSADTGVSDWARAEALDLPKKGEKNQVSRNVYLPAGRRERVKLTVPVEEIGERRLVVSLKDLKTLGTFQREILDNPPELTPLDVTLDRLYYASEKTGRVYGRIALPEAGLKDWTARLKMGEKTLTEGPASRTLDLSFSTESVAEGTHAARLELANATGKAMFSQPLALIKRKPNPGKEWNIDKIGLTVLDNGESFIPLGIIVSEVTDTSAREAWESGFNLIVKWGGDVTRYSPAESVAAARVAEAYGLKMMDRLETYCAKEKIPELAKYLSPDALKRQDIAISDTCQLKGNLYLRPDFLALSRADRNAIFNTYFQRQLPRIVTGVETIKNQFSLMGYATFDEPLFGTFDQYVQGRELYAAVNRADGYHPTFLLYSSTIPEGPEASDWGDILATDPYWIPGGTDLRRNSVNFVSKIVARTSARAEKDRKVTWITPMTEYWSGSHKRFISPKEQICQTYLALIHGAKGLAYFIYPVRHVGVRGAFQELGRQFKTLGPALAAPKIPQKIDYRPIAFDPEKESFPAVQVLSLKDPNGGFILLAANSAPFPVGVRYAFDGLTLSETVRRLFSAETYRAEKNAFSDRLGPFETRAYRLEATMTAPTVAVQVVSDTARSPAPREIGVGYEGRTDMKNVIANPSFEEAVLDDLPDYYMPNGKTRVGGPDGHMTLVKNDPVDGARCLRLTSDGDPTFPAYVGFKFYCSPKHPAPTPYVFSLYLKGDREGLQVYFGNHEWKKWKTATLTTTWKRFDLSGVMPANASRQAGNFELQFIGPGTVWLDALQLEKGETPTAFAP